MEPFATGDGSITLRNPEYDEFYHSKSGAIEESVEKYVRPCRISELSKKGHIKILDIGFGLGYNIIAAVDEALNINPNCEIEVISLEKEVSILEELKKLEPNLKNYPILKKLEYDPKNSTYLYEDKNIFLKLIIGDATQTIKKIDNRFDAVFHDPFSPKKNPEMWTREFFEEVSKRMKKEAILATYSYAKEVRKALQEAGFEVYDGPIIGRRSPSTLARLKL